MSSVPSEELIGNQLERYSDFGGVGELLHNILALMQARRTSLLQCYLEESPLCSDQNASEKVSWLVIAKVVVHTCDVIIHETNADKINRNTAEIFRVYRVTDNLESLGSQVSTPLTGNPGRGCQVLALIHQRRRNATRKQIPWVQDEGPKLVGAGSVGDWNRGYRDESSAKVFLKTIDRLAFVCDIAVQLPALTVAWFTQCGGENVIAAKIRGLALIEKLSCLNLDLLVVDQELLDGAREQCLR